MVKLNQNKTGNLIDPPDLDTEKFPWPPLDVMDWVEYVKAKPQPLWMIPNLLPYDAAVLVSGRAKIAWKTWYGFFVSLSIGLGRSWVPEFSPTRPEKVLIIELEGPEKQTANRIELLLKPFQAQLPKNQVRFIHRYPLLIDDPRWLRALCDFVSKEGIKFVLVDTLATANRGSENDAQAMGDVMRAFGTLRHAMDGGTVMYLHHLRKPTEKPGIDIDDDIRGTSALAGFYDVHHAIRRPYSDQKWLDLTVRQSDSAEREYQLRWVVEDNGEGAKMSITSMDADNLTDEQIRQFGEQLITGVEYTFRMLKDAWKVNGDSVKKIREELVKNDVVARLDRGKVRLA